MLTHHFKGFAARAGAVTLLSVGMIAGFAGAPAMAQTPTTQWTINYTVLGDSFSAGSGGGDEAYVPCGQSPNGYGNDVAAATHATLTNLACSGFTTDQVRTLEVPYLASDTQLVTLTAGGNDVGWATTVAACLDPASTTAMCTSAISSSVQLMTKLPTKVTALLKAVKAKAPGARVLYLGYPRLFEPHNMPALGFTPTQVTGAKALNAAADLLNGILAFSALSNRTAFVPVAYLFSGHGIPSASPWLNYPGGPNPYAFHPTAEGYQNGYTVAVMRFL
ncbi:SGNH/GDSL hydrolase family protein [Arthrobacter sp. LAPM80]|uniref:SGNH/GDSL hydrolase family protein n=1 Tax=Arthrobacter sp. LAPM80 TaxID=3141788 RepID=UPI00398B9A40